MGNSKSRPLGLRVVAVADDPLSGRPESRLLDNVIAGRGLTRCIHSLSLYNRSDVLLYSLMYRREEACARVVDIPSAISQSPPPPLDTSLRLMMRNDADDAVDVQ